MKQLSELVDTKVVDANGEPIGSVDELILNTRSGRIDRIIVKTPDLTRFSLNWADLIVRGNEFMVRAGVRS